MFARFKKMILVILLTIAAVQTERCRAANGSYDISDYILDHPFGGFWKTSSKERDQIFERLKAIMNVQLLYGLKEQDIWLSDLLAHHEMLDPKTALFDRFRLIEQIVRAQGLDPVNLSNSQIWQLSVEFFVLDDSGFAFRDAHADLELAGKLTERISLLRYDTFVSYANHQIRTGKLHVWNELRREILDRIPFQAGVRAELIAWFDALKRAAYHDRARAILNTFHEVSEEAGLALARGAEAYRHLQISIIHDFFSRGNRMPSAQRLVTELRKEVSNEFLASDLAETRFDHMGKGESCSNFSAPTTHLNAVKTSMSRWISRLAQRRAPRLNPR